MPMDVHIDDLYELVDVQTAAGQEVLNVYFYRTGSVYVTTFPTNAQLVAENWAAQILPDIAAAQNAAVTHTAVKVRNLYDPTDAFTLVHSVPGGGSATDVLPNFSAVPFELQGETMAVRKGAKRLAGIAEAEQTSGVITDSGFITLLGDAGDAMARPIQVGTLIMSDVFFPTLVKRVRSGTPGNYTYELPSVRGTGVWTTVINALFDALISSQVSRKIGVGA